MLRKDIFSYKPTCHSLALSQIIVYIIVRLLTFYNCKAYNFIWLKVVTRLRAPRAKRMKNLESHVLCY